MQSHTAYYGAQSVHRLVREGQSNYGAFTYSATFLSSPQVTRPVVSPNALAPSAICPARAIILSVAFFLYGEYREDPCEKAAADAALGTGAGDH